MVTIVSGTNRANNQTLNFVKHYQKLLKENHIESQILDLSTLPQDFLYTALYGLENKEFNQILEQYIFNAAHLVVISPEYNGSYPGILKAFIDGWNPKKLNGQKVALMGVASGRQGNSRGMDHLTNVFNYLNLAIVPLKIPVSQIFALVDENGNVQNEELDLLIHKQIKMLVN